MRAIGLRRSHRVAALVIGASTLGLWAGCLSGDPSILPETTGEGGEAGPRTSSDPNETRRVLVDGHQWQIEVGARVAGSGVIVSWFQARSAQFSLEHRVRELTVTAEWTCVASVPSCPLHLAFRSPDHDPSHAVDGPSPLTLTWKDPPPGSDWWVWVEPALNPSAAFVMAQGTLGVVVEG